MTADQLADFDELRALFVANDCVPEYLKLREVLAKDGDPSGYEYPECYKCGNDEEFGPFGLCSSCRNDLVGWLVVDKHEREAQEAADELADTCRDCGVSGVVGEGLCRECYNEQEA